ncbi:MAG: class I SAM-dependent methyltransferase [Desulforhopalus sp.]
MDIRTLPDAERRIYNRLRKHYSVTFDRLRIGEQKIRLLKISDIEEYLAGRDPFAKGSKFPFWTHLWDGSMILSYILGSQPNAQGKRLLEIGAGLGAPGLAAATAGFEVTISNYEDIVTDFQRVSAAASKLKGINFIQMDWFNPPSPEPFDVLAGAEILFREDLYQPLLNVMRALLKTDGAIYLAHDAKRQGLSKFLKLAEADFDIGLKEQSINRTGKKVTVLINRLRLKQNRLP